MRFRPSFALLLPAWALAALALVLLFRGAPTAQALDGSVAVDCDAATGGLQSNCAYPVGATFDVQIHVTAAPTGGYFSHQMKLRWSDSLVDYLATANPADENLWGYCTLPLRLDNRTNDPPDPSVLFGCTALPPLRGGETGTGAILQFQFQCQQAGSGPLQLVPRVGDLQNGSHFLDAALNPIEPTLTDATVACVAAPAPTPTATPPDPNLDTDGDGCSDIEEQSADPLLGGQRDPFSFWDFFDTPDQSNVRDKAIAISDLGRLVARFGATRGSPPTKQEALAEALSPPPPAPAYHAAFDRGGPIPGQNLWNQLSPNGTIAIADIGGIVAQFGHYCA